MQGSIFNRMMDATESTPVKGEGATILMHSDRHAATVIEVIPFKSGPNKGKPRMVRVQRDKAVRTDDWGMSDMQDYAYERDESGAIRTFTAKRDGSFPGIIFGIRREYYDYSY